MAWNKAIHAQYSRSHESGTKVTSLMRSGQ